jgi:hypothetical protein
VRVRISILPNPSVAPSENSLARSKNRALISHFVQLTDAEIDNEHRQTNNSHVFRKERGADSDLISLFILVTVEILQSRCLQKLAAAVSNSSILSFVFPGALRTGLRGPSCNHQRFSSFPMAVRAFWALTLNGVR